MTTRQHRAEVRALLDRYGQTYAEEAGIRLGRGTPAPLYQLLCMAMLLSAPIQSGNAIQAARALRQAGLTTPRKMAEASWQDRVDVITWHGYKRYDERESTLLGDTAQRLLDRYGGDLRKLREEADGRRDHLERLLQQFKGIGKVGASIFLREVQGVWTEVYPYADERVLRGARHLDLGCSARDLTHLVSRRDYPRLCAALIRVELDKGQKAIKQTAA